MNRKTFLTKILATGASACCGAALLGPCLQAQVLGQSPAQNPAAQDWIDALRKRMLESSRTPESDRFKKASTWIRDLLNNMDNILDNDTKIKLMHACGRSCHIDAFGVAGDEKPTDETAQRWMAYLRNAGYDITRAGNLTIVQYSWGRDHQNPWGLMIKDGYCLCPIVESIPKDLSPTFCNCSAGYVKEMFRRYLGKPVDVELVETLQMGGTDCRFKITIHN
ncbi:MAG: hypothetical protein JW763_01950 [candidate division Zixibacteria bacterium]|nr:hypothetical protein [candidate division Zixibacteria bacterium]